MQRAIQLANQGKFSVAPNPRVGAVVVHNGKIIGEGYHAKYSEAHAEVNAIESAEDKALLAESTLYVTLEPCSHFGKTPPCVDLILKHKVPTVVIANRDPFDKVNGSGIEKLEKAGVKVILNVMAEEGRALNKRFFTFYEKKRPYIILKWAETADGFISRKYSEIANKNNWITSALSKQLVHQWRSEEQAILVGRNTVEIDNPQLDCREVDGANPIRLIIDQKAKLNKESNIFNSAAKTIVFNEKVDKVSKEIEYVKLPFGKDLMTALNDFCYKRQIQSVFVEGGQFTLNQFIETGNWDECRVFKSQLSFEEGISAPTFRGVLKTNEQLKEDKLSIYFRANK